MTTQLAGEGSVLAMLTMGLEGQGGAISGPVNTQDDCIHTDLSEFVFPHDHVWDSRLRSGMHAPASCTW
jgi:hypothetical protein